MGWCTWSITPWNGGLYSGVHLPKECSREPTVVQKENNGPSTWIYFVLFYLNIYIRICFRVIPNVYYSDLLNKSWMSNWPKFTLSPCPAEGPVYIRYTVNFYKVLIHLVRFFFFSFYFKILDVITFIKVLESGMEGDSQKIKSYFEARKGKFYLPGTWHRELLKQVGNGTRIFNERLSLEYSVKGMWQFRPSKKEVS